ncbi:MAG TPA: 1,4-dihydroxy-2-naphthoate octaprenyltransferase [Oligoflexus sp.]|uniref:1,4-dihydroxy-2-naphthoate octaprenyltransferase n=1 Tax=Oligoflexus sp. TaxID=1971216 RepID=UPI002D56E385|nr:1,4-dihydroxy-2-naphthoate octaprenyltransferase [Oligoflexus sp.]HYX38853.1 1,4-dihydroxy-2-naphthoate octaprenyltransferase [Oligoflexus sp.]
MNTAVSTPVTIQPRSWRALIQAIRPPTLLAGLGPVLIGISLGVHQRDVMKISEGAVVFPALAALLLVVFLQAAANLVNDAKDAEKGVDKGERLGPIRVVQSGLLTIPQVRLAYWTMFALAAGLVVALFAMNPAPVIPLVALACGLAAYLYTAGPFPLAYYALGEILACIFFGPIAVMGTVYLLTGYILWETAFWGLGSGLIAAAIMAVNNLRDRKGDKDAGKHTLATLSSEQTARKLPLLLVMASAMILALYGFEHNKVIIAVPWALLALSFIRRRITPRLQGEGPLLNEALKFTALFNLFYAMLFASLVLL